MSRRFILKGRLDSKVSSHGWQVEMNHDSFSLHHWYGRSSLTWYTRTPAIPEHRPVSNRFEVEVESIQNHSELYQSIAYGKGFAPLVGIVGRAISCPARLR